MESVRERIKLAEEFFNFKLELVTIHDYIYQHEDIYTSISNRAKASTTDLESYNIFLEMTSNWRVIDRLEGYLLSNGLEHQLRQIILGSKGVHEAIKEVESQLQKALDQLLQP